MLTFTLRRSSPAMGSEEPQLITANRFLTITAGKGRDRELG